MDAQPAGCGLDCGAPGNLDRPLRHTCCLCCAACARLLGPAERGAAAPGHRRKLHPLAKQLQHRAQLQAAGSHGVSSACLLCAGWPSAAPPPPHHHPRHHKHKHTHTAIHPTRPSSRPRALKPGIPSRTSRPQQRYMRPELHAGDLHPSARPRLPPRLLSPAGPCWPVAGCTCPGWLHACLSGTCCQLPGRWSSPQSRVRGPGGAGQGAGSRSARAGALHTKMVGRQQGMLPAAVLAGLRCALPRITHCCRLQGHAFLGLLHLTGLARPPYLSSKALNLKFKFLLAVADCRDPQPRTTPGR